MIKKIMKDDWYKAATREEMRIALLHLEQQAMDNLFNQLTYQKAQSRQAAFEKCSIDCKWENGTKDRG